MGVEEVFCNFQRFRDSEFMCDVALEAEDTKFHVHKIILSASSEYFKTLFSTDMRERNQDAIELKGISAPALQVCLDSIYSGRPSELTGNIDEVLHAACLFQMWDLKSSCFKVMQNELTLQNCFQYFKLSQMYDADGFPNTILKFICKNFAFLRKSEDFLNSAKDVVETVIKSSDLEIADETDVFDSIVSWIEHDVYYRKQYFCNLFKLVRLQFVSKAYFIDNILYHTLTRNCANCCNHIKNLLMHQRNVLGLSLTTMHRSDRGGKNLLILNEDCSRMYLYDFERQTPNEIAIPKRELKTSIHCKLTVIIGSKLYVVGSIDDETMYCCDVVCKTGWQKISSMSVVHNTRVVNNLYLSGVVVFNDHVLVIGGHDGESYLRLVEAFNLKTNSWQMLPQMNTSRESVAVATLEKHVYAIGGYNGHGLSSVERYSIETNEWTNVSSLHGCRYDSSATSFGGKIYVMGGIVGNNFMEHNVLHSTEIYNEIDNTWTVLSDMNYCRSNMGVCHLNNQLFVVGGSANCDSSFYEIYNEEKKRWEASDEFNDEDFVFCKSFAY